jgi:hypothetical protein
MTHQVLDGVLAAMFIFAIPYALMRVPLTISRSTQLTIAGGTVVLATGFASVVSLTGELPLWALSGCLIFGTLRYGAVLMAVLSGQEAEKLEGSVLLHATEPVAVFAAATMLGVSLSGAAAAGALTLGGSQAAYLVNVWLTRSSSS